MDVSVLVGVVVLALAGGVIFNYVDNLKCASIVLGRALYTGSAADNNKATISLLTVARGAVGRMYLVLMSALFYLPNVILVAGGIFSYFYYVRIGALIFMLVYFLGAYLTRSFFPYKLAYYIDLYHSFFKKVIPSNLGTTDPQREAAANTLLLQLERMHTIYRDSPLGLPIGKEEVNSVALGDLAYLKNKNPLLFPDLREKELARRKEAARQNSSHSPT